MAAFLADDGRHSGNLATRTAAGLLGGALAGLRALLDDDFLHTGGPVGEVVRAYAADHGHPSALKVP